MTFRRPSIRFAEVVIIILMLIPIFFLVKPYISPTKREVTSIELNESYPHNFFFILDKYDFNKNKIIDINVFQTSPNKLYVGEEYSITMKLTPRNINNPSICAILTDPYNIIRKSYPSIGEDPSHISGYTSFDVPIKFKFKILETNLKLIEGRWNLTILIFDEDNNELTFHMSRPIEFLSEKSDVRDIDFIFIIIIGGLSIVMTIIIPLLMLGRLKLKRDKKMRLMK